MAASQTKSDISRIRRLQLPVVVRLASRKMKLQELLGLSVGSLIEFDRPASDSLDLLVGLRMIGTGSPVVVGEKFGLRVDAIGGLPAASRQAGSG